MTIVHVVNTKQGIIHIWIIGKIYMLIFYFIPHFEEQKPQMLHCGAVEEEMADVIYLITVWTLRWCFYFHMEYIFITTDYSTD